MDDKKSLLQIESLYFGYNPNKLIYEDFSLDLKKGELISIVGNSGSGKSTLFELICENLKPLKGKINSVKLSSIYQDPYSSFHPSFTIKNQINDVVNIKGDAFEKKLIQYLEKLNLDKKNLYKKPHELSGGQLQRCSILRALLMEPEVLLVDEPTSALDNVVAYEVMKLLVSFLDKCAILLITHDKNLALWCSNKIINLNEIMENR